MKRLSPLQWVGCGPLPSILAHWIWLLPALAHFTCSPACSQLAITEVMSNAVLSPLGGDDYWELTNFGDEPVDLTSYWFNDGDGFSGAVNLGSLWDQARWNAPQIEPGESVLFVRVRNGLISKPEDFRRWWGEERVGSQVKINFYIGYGLDNVRDSINLWRVTDEEPRLVHRIELFKSPAGRSLTYDPSTGVFGPFSDQSVGGAFLAATTADVGSPGITQGRAAIHVIETPQDNSVDAGSSCTFHVQATGMPPPALQWLFQGDPIPGARGESYVIPTVTAAMAGSYAVVLDNGLERTQTLPATLRVNTQASCARIERSPADAAVTLDQTAVFSVETRGYPLPDIRWEFEGRELPGETNRTLRVEGVNETVTGRYTVFVSNAFCTTNVSARLILEPTPELRVTEAMAFPVDKHGLHHDTWWELTNEGTNAVNLRGYRWNDHPAYLDGAVTVTNDVVLAPGRSAIFVSGMSGEAFRQWWGAENLPEDLAILTFNGISLSTNGDLVEIWNATALRDEEWLLVSPTIIGSEMGRSLWYDPILARKGASSVEGQGSAFRAAVGGDVGSPGWTARFPRVRRPRMLELRRQATGTMISWSTEPKARYELWRHNLAPVNSWTMIARREATGDSLSAMDTLASNPIGCLYRVIRLP